MTAGGGTIAAFGLKYQYMATIEQFLRYLRGNLDLLPRVALEVEPLVFAAGGAVDDIVDFGFLTDGIATHHYQVKSSLNPAENPLTPAAAREVLQRLAVHNAQDFALYTNKPLSPALAHDVTVDNRRSPRAGVVSYEWSPALIGLSQPDPHPTITVDSRGRREIRGSISALIRDFRRDRQLSLGEITCDLLVPILLEKVFDAAASDSPYRIDALEVVELLAMPDARIAKIVGGFDWGLPLSGVPHYASTVPRLAHLAKIRSEFPDDSTYLPPRIVLAGHTGSGKSVVASDYCHLDAVSFAFMCWLDCRDSAYLDSQIRDLVLQLTSGTPVSDGDIAPVFTGLLGRHPGPWLLVFDGALCRGDIERYLPTRGHGVILITSVNETGWWSDSTVIEVKGFTSAEAELCFRAYSGLQENEVDDHVVVEIVESLGNIPLAVSMAGLYFKNAQGSVSELAPQYFADLAALDDSLSIPPGFNRTAFKAVQHAVATLAIDGPTGHGTSARAVLEMGSLLAPEQIPLNLMLQATVPTIEMDAAKAPRPSEADPVLRRGVVATLRTQSIARRTLRTAENQSPTDETVAVHPLIHQILQTSRLRALPPGQLQADSTVLMHFLRGWLGSLRVGGDFLGTDQIRIHAEAVLAIADAHEPLHSYGPQEQRVYAYTKALLQAELSTCHASRGRYDRSIYFARAAAAALRVVGTEPAANAMSVPILANIIHDLSFMQVSPGVLAALAVPAVWGIEAVIADSRPAYQDLGYTFAGELRFSLTRTADYQSSEALRGLNEILRRIIDSDPRADTRPAAQNALINELYNSRKFEDLGRLIPSLRADADPDTHIDLDALDIVVQLRTGSTDDGLTKLHELIELDPHAGYLSHSLIEALSKVNREIHRIIHEGDSVDSRLSGVLPVIAARVATLQSS